MTSIEKATLLGYIHMIQRELQTIVDGQDPDLKPLDMRRERADWHMVHMLREIAGVLPNDLRAEVQACLSINDHLWSAEYSQACFHSQKETNPICLPAVDAF